jgi:hypothetical protein
MQDDASQPGGYQVARYFSKALYASNIKVQLHSEHNMKDGELSLAEGLFCTSIAQTFECFPTLCHRISKHRSCSSCLRNQ